MMNMVYKTFKRFASETSGTTLTELAIVIPLLLLILMGAVEFGRLGYNIAMVQKATELAVRTAAVRPPICDGVPDTFEIGTSASAKAGSLCKAGAPGSICKIVITPPPCSLANPGTTDSNKGRTTAEERSDAAQEIWDAIAPLLPNTTDLENSITAANVFVRYEQDARIGFLSGPYTPVVTVEIGQLKNGDVERLDYKFITPLGQLAGMAMLGGTSNIRSSFQFPTMSASMSGEDLANGPGS